MIKSLCICLFILAGLEGSGQLKWTNVDTLYGPLPPSLHIYYTESSPDTGAFRAFYVVADLKDRKLEFSTDTTKDRRLTPSEFYNRNAQPIVVVNGTFFSFETNRNLNLVIREGKVISYNNHTLFRRSDSMQVPVEVFPGTIGISRRGRADVAWTRTDSSSRTVFAAQEAVPARAGRESIIQKWPLRKFRKWKVETAIGGGPVLVQKGSVSISNNEELKFSGKAIHDRHPRTAMGYTADNRLVILVIEGRNPAARGATLVETADILKDLGCVEALNLDGGGSSCLLVNGKETIRPSSNGEQRPVPAVFFIRRK